MASVKTLNQNAVCSSSTEQEPVQRQKCEVYSRVVGYLSPVHRWNSGKKSEFHDRRMFNIWSRMPLRA